MVYQGSKERKVMQKSDREKGEIAVEKNIHNRFIIK